MNEEMSTVEYWEQIYQGKSKAQPGGHEADRFARVMELFKPGPERVLEIAAGYAALAKRIRNKYPEKLVSALDFAPEAAKRSGFQPYHIADAENTGLPSDSFDTIVCCQGMGYMASPEAFLKEASRLAFPVSGPSFGRLVLTVSDGIPSAGTRHEWNAMGLLQLLEGYGVVTNLWEGHPSILIAEVIMNAYPGAA